MYLICELREQGQFMPGKKVSKIRLVEVQTPGYWDALRFNTEGWIPIS